MSRACNRLFVALVAAASLASFGIVGTASADAQTEVVAGVCCWVR